jgi:hypothetical protein
VTIAKSFAGKHRSHRFSVVCSIQVRLKTVGAVLAREEVLPSAKSVGVNLEQQDNSLSLE